MDENTVSTPVEAVPATPVITPAEVPVTNDGNITTGTITAIATAQVTAKQSRWKSAILWAAIIAQVIAILQLTGAFKAIGLDAGYVGNVTATVLQLLVIIGVVNNPSDPTAI
jgi:uncharacterized membrane protein